MFFRTPHLSASSIGLFALAIAMVPLCAQPLESITPVAAGTWHSDQVTHLLGLPDVRENAKGSLSISASPSSLVFSTPSGHASIDRARMLSVTLGDERQEMGGTAGRVTRAIIPFGGGSALATVTNRKVGLLTIEFRDEHNALHGAVFLLPQDDAARAYDMLGSPVTSAEIEQPHTACPSAATPNPHTLGLQPIVTLGAAVPAEYRVLLYEQLMARLQQQGSFAGIYRDGDDTPSASCSQYTLVLTLNAFKKGNAAVRASTGPVGFFVATTSLKFHVQVRDENGKMLLDKDFKASQRGDSESLNVAAKIANAVAKQLQKASALSHWS